MWNVAQKLYWLALTMQEQHFQQSWCSLEMVYRPPPLRDHVLRLSPTRCQTSRECYTMMTDPDLPVYMWETASCQLEMMHCHMQTCSIMVAVSRVVMQPFSCCDFNVDHNWAAKGLEEYPCVWMDTFGIKMLTVQLMNRFNKEVVIKNDSFIR